MPFCGAFACVCVFMRVFVDVSAEVPPEDEAFCSPLKIAASVKGLNYLHPHYSAEFCLESFASSQIYPSSTATPTAH